MRHCFQPSLFFIFESHLYVYELFVLRVQMAAVCLPWNVLQHSEAPGSSYYLQSFLPKHITLEKETARRKNVQEDVSEDNKTRPKAANKLASNDKTLQTSDLGLAANTEKRKSGVSISVLTPSGDGDDAGSKEKRRNSRRSLSIGAEDLVLVLSKDKNGSSIDSSSVLLPAIVALQESKESVSRTCIENWRGIILCAVSSVINSGTAYLAHRLIHREGYSSFQVNISRFLGLFFFSSIHVLILELRKNPVVTHFCRESFQENKLMLLFVGVRD